MDSDDSIVSLAGILQNFPSLFSTCSTWNLLEHSFVQAHMNECQSLLIPLSSFMQSILLYLWQSIFIFRLLKPFSTTSHTTCDPSSAFMRILQLSQFPLVSFGNCKGNLHAFIIFLSFLWSNNSLRTTTIATSNPAIKHQISPFGVDPVADTPSPITLCDGSTTLKGKYLKCRWKHQFWSHRAQSIFKATMKMKVQKFTSSAKMKTTSAFQSKGIC